MKDSNHSCWCGNLEWDVIFTVGDYSLLRCYSCGTYRNDPIPLASDSESEEFYTEYYNDGHQIAEGSNEIARNSRFWKVVNKSRVLNNQIPSKALDIGSGDGRLVAELDKAGWHSTGVEISRSRVEVSRKLYPGLSFYPGDVFELKEELGKFDLIVLDNVIEHLPNPKEFALKVHELMHENGLFVAITPNMNSGNFRLLGKRWTPELCPHSHIYLFTEQSLNQCLIDAGFEVVESGNFQLNRLDVGNYVNRALKLDAKGIVWRIVQDSGSIYSKLIDQGEMIYSIVKSPS